MLVLIDDSGDPGFKLDKGSSKNFVVACILFEDEVDSMEAALKIRRLKQKRGKTDRFEFKFNKCSKDYRIQFLKTTSTCNFVYRAIVVEKEKIHSQELRKSKDSFYSYFIKMVLQHSFGSIKAGRIRIDGSGNREFRNRLATYLRKAVNDRSTIVKDVKFRNSKNDVLIQLADMVAGAVNRSYSKKKDAKIYRKLIKSKEQDVWTFTK